ncbi:MAG: helix-turn-helix domain-containing protein [Gammaproteobacteria bacterium]|nr:helix-turn-helix domain-containing protein [Gammaproteobacteria bacterium]
MFDSIKYDIKFEINQRKRRLSQFQIEDLLLHPVRMRIVLSLAGEQLTSKEIGSRLPDVSHATLYRHIRALADAGALQVIEERQRRGSVERTYALAIQEHMNLDASFAAADEQAQLRYFLTFVVSLLQDFALYLRQPDGQGKEDFGFHSIVVNLSDQEFAQLSRQLNALFSRYLKNEPSNTRTPRSLSTIVIPRVKG